jgi:hypothetical protein
MRLWGHGLENGSGIPVRIFGDVSIATKNPYQSRTT